MSQSLHCFKREQKKSKRILERIIFVPSGGTDTKIGVEIHEEGVLSKSRIIGIR